MSIADGGSIFTVITSLGAAGKATLFAGHELTIASLAIHGTSTSSGGSSTPSSTSPASSNGASSRSLSVSSSAVVASFVTVFGVFVGGFSLCEHDLEWYL